MRIVGHKCQATVIRLLEALCITGPALRGCGGRHRSQQLQQRRQQQQQQRQQTRCHGVLRYAGLELGEAELIKKGIMFWWLHREAKGRLRYLATAAHFEAAASTGTNVNVGTADDSTKLADAWVYHINPWG